MILWFYDTVCLASDERNPLCTLQDCSVKWVKVRQMGMTVWLKWGNWLIQMKAPLFLISCLLTSNEVDTRCVQMSKSQDYIPREIHFLRITPLALFRLPVKLSSIKLPLLHLPQTYAITISFFPKSTCHNYTLSRFARWNPWS